MGYPWYLSYLSYLFVAAFVSGLLLAVRLMFFGAERRRQRQAELMPLRRSEPAIVAFLVMFGAAGYLLTRHGVFTSVARVVTASVLGVGWAFIVTRLAIATARLQPEHDPVDSRYVLQGRVGMAMADIPIGGEGTISYEDDLGVHRAVQAREIAGGAITAGEEVCIERLVEGVAYVERWASVEQRL